MNTIVFVSRWRILYRNYTKPEKDIRRATYDYADMYLTYGSLLVEMKRPGDAAKALSSAMKWNPSYARIAFEYAETFKMRTMIEEFKDITMGIFKYAYRPADLARCYRNLGYYFVEMKDYETAVCCLLFSMQFAKSEMVNSELYYISQMIGKLYDPTDDELDEHFDRYHIPHGPEIEMLKIAYSYGRHFFETGDMSMAAYFLEIFTDFIKEDEVLKMYEEASVRAAGNEKK